MQGSRLALCLPLILLTLLVLFAGLSFAQELEVHQLGDGVVLEKLRKQPEAVSLQALADIAKSIASAPGKISETVKQSVREFVWRIERAVIIGLSLGIGVPFAAFLFGRFWFKQT